MSDGFRIASAYVQVEASDDGFRAQLEAKLKAATDGVAARVRIDADAAGLEAEVKAAAESAHAEAHVAVKVDKAGSGDFESEFRRAMQEGQQVSDAAAQDLRNSYTAVQNASSALRQSMAELGNDADDSGKKLENAGQKADSGKSGLDQLKSAADATGTALRIVSMISLAPSLGAIPSIAAGAAGGLATLVLGLGDVIKVLREAGQASGAMGESGAQMALTAFNNAVAIRNANQAIADAERQAAQQAIASAESIANAKRGVADATRQAAMQQISSAEQVANAQQSEGDAERQAAIAAENSADSEVSASQRYQAALVSEAQAQRDLTLAKQDAANQIADLNNANADATLSVQAAQLALQQAERNDKATQADSLATQLQKQQSTLAVAQAQQALVDAQQRATEAQQAATRANSEGADGLPSVVDAQQKLHDAVIAVADANHAVAIANRDAANQQISSAEQVANAQQRLGDAQRQQTNQEISSAEQIQNAQRQLADAERQAAQQQIQSAEQVAKAKQALADLEEQQKLAAAAAAASSGQAASMMARDYAKLTPAGKAFVDQVLAMRSSLHLLEADAQTAMLPGFTQMLKDSQHLLPIVEVGVTNTGRAFGNTAIAFGNLFANPTFDQSAMKFTQLVTGGFGQFLSALPPLLNAIVTDGVQAAPLINAVAAGVHDLIATGLPDFLSGLNYNAGGAAQGVGALFRAVDGLLGPVGTVTGALAGALGPALATLEPGFMQLVNDVEAGLLPLMPQLSTDLVDVATIFNQLFTILEPIIPIISNDLAAGLRVVDPLLRDTAQFLQDNQRWLTPVAEGILAVVVAVKAWGLATGAIKSGVTIVTNAMSAFSDAAENAAGKAGSVAGALGGTEGLASKLGIVGMVTGGVVAGIFGVGEALNHVIYGGGAAASSVDQFTQALLQSESSTDNATLGLDKYSQMAQEVGAANKGVTDSFAQVGLGMIELGKGTFGTTQDMKNYDASLAAMVSNGNADRAAAVVKQLADATNAHGLHIVDVNKDLPQYAAAVEKAGVQSLSTARATQNNADATTNLSNATQTATDKFQFMTNAMSQSQALDQFRSQLLNLKDTLDQNGSSLDANTTKGLANRDAFSQIARQIEDYGRQLSQSGEADGLVAVKMQDMVTQLENAAGQYGYSKQQVDAYVKSIGLIPSSVQTNVNAAINLSVNQQLLEEAAQQIGHVVGGHILVPGQAAGGLVTGPGTGTSDSVLRRLSNGEYVMTAQAVQQVGVPYLDALNYGAPYGGRIPQVGGTTPQAGAPVINLNYYGSTLPTPEQQQVIMRDLTLAVRS
jgi:hypothetical protein